jgi:hypothetical protein
MGNNNTGIGVGANVSAGFLTNATAIGFNAVVDASNKIRLGNTSVMVIQGQCHLLLVRTKTRRKTLSRSMVKKFWERFAALSYRAGTLLDDPKKFRHYGSMAQDFYAAFGHDGIGRIGSETTINSGDIAGILMIAVQALEKRTAELKQKEARIALLESRLEALELRQNPSFQITAERSVSVQ